MERSGKTKRSRSRIRSRVQKELTELRTRLTKLEPNYVKPLRTELLLDLEAAKAKLTTSKRSWRYQLRS